MKYRDSGKGTKGTVEDRGVLHSTENRYMHKTLISTPKCEAFAISLVALSLPTIRTEVSLDFVRNHISHVPV